MVVIKETLTPDNVESVAKKYGLDPVRLAATAYCNTCKKDGMSPAPIITAMAYMEELGDGSLSLS